MCSSDLEQEDAVRGQGDAGNIDSSGPRTSHLLQQDRGEAQECGDDGGIDEEHGPPPEAVEHDPPDNRTDDEPGGEGRGEYSDRPRPLRRIGE